MSDPEDFLASRLCQKQFTQSSIAKPARPKEFSLWMALSFVTSFIVLAILLAVVYIKARIFGMFCDGPVEAHLYFLTHHRTAITEFKHTRAKYIGKLHTHCIGHVGRANVGPDQSVALLAATARAAAERRLKSTSIN